MAYLKLNKEILINFDTEGFLQNPDDWNEILAIQIAKKENITLNSEHWELIKYTRDFYFKFNILPSIRLLVNIISKKYGKIKGNSRYLLKLFPGGPATQVMKIAGLPNNLKCL